MQLTFQVTSEARSSIDTFIGDVYGNIFLSRDVTLLGPIDNAEQFGAIEIKGFDFSADDALSDVWESEPLPIGEYTFLGYVDLNANHQSRYGEPDKYEPVTLPGPDKQFSITGEATLTQTIPFDFSTPSTIR